jgi:magnesium and cobalt transporter
VTDQSGNGSSGLSWLERIGQTLLGEPRDRQDVLVVLRDAEQRGLLTPDILSMVEGALQVSEMRVRDVMVPRAQMVMLDMDDPLEELLKVVIDSAHSRFPVYRETRDEVEGILLAKDILPYLAKQSQEPFPIRDLMRPAVFIPESKRLNVLLREFRSSRNHMAVVVDEYGGVAGLVTIEDVLEQIVGEIDDEHDVEDEESFVKRHGPNEFTLKALMPIEDFNQTFGTAFEDGEFDTVGGLLLKALGHLPGRGETVTLDGIRFEVLNADGRRIYLVKIDTSGRQPPAADQGA